ncbi:flagellar biosynthetic protein FliQ [Aestuariivita sp.]|uniref:flagellar biosynthetic protein FliQ n=1 Tax=Aestuariivita sp. TaxID=1872407 RepID=UPI00216EC1A9|nr:flagellar biosynthetic protein FliQ [Aestuariivita sp.]MCE8008980.1 flagellar biosynthetic protein FliQ [Aestuariivita sp.]
MDSTSILDILRDMIGAILWGSAPVLISSLVVGLLISFFQALTQIQEMTLTFVPKIVVIFVVLGVTLPFTYGVLRELSAQIFDLIVSGGI